MTALVTLEQAKLHLRENDDDLTDADVSMKMQQATDIVLDYLKVDPGWTVETVPGDVHAAILLVLSGLYDGRDGTEIITSAVASLLDPAPRSRDGMKPPAWYPDWRGQICVIVGSGPSAKDAELELARGRAKVLAINNSWQLAPWADALYACDNRWWSVHAEALKFPGLKITQASECPEVVHRVLLIGSPTLSTEPGKIGSGQNSGFQASNLAVQFGARSLVLVGFDMRIDQGLHWHGAHRSGLSNPRLERVKRWREYFDGAAGEFKRLGVTVINTSAVSALKNYPKMSLAEALQTAGA